jgi:hypothetical protein
VSLFGRAYAHGNANPLRSSVTIKAKVVLVLGSEGSPPGGHAFCFERGSQDAIHENAESSLRLLAPDAYAVLE